MSPRLPPHRLYTIVDVVVNEWLAVGSVSTIPRKHDHHLNEARMVKICRCLFRSRRTLMKEARPVLGSSMTTVRMRQGYHRKKACPIRMNHDYHWRKHIVTITGGICTVARWHKTETLIHATFCCMEANIELRKHVRKQWKYLPLSIRRKHGVSAEKRVDISHL
jgi:hypothetical protein